MYIVYYTETEKTGATVPKSVLFESTEMVEALHHCEALRTLRKCGAALSFITMVSEVPGMVGDAGCNMVVDGKLPNGDEYKWKKRRV